MLMGFRPLVAIGWDWPRRPRNLWGLLCCGLELGDLDYQRGHLGVRCCEPVEVADQVGAGVELVQTNPVAGIIEALNDRDEFACEVDSGPLGVRLGGHVNNVSRR